MAPRRSVFGAIVLMTVSGCAGGRGIPPPPSTTTLLPGTTSGAAIGVAGSAGIGDPYFPDLGNGGYDVEHYDIALTIDPDSGTITTAETTVTAEALIALSAFDLDFTGLEVLGVDVDGVPADWRVRRSELVITPQVVLPAGETFTVAVTYRGRPQPIFIPSVGENAGWIVDGEGVYVAAEPDGAHTWFPGNDHPSDKATFGIDVTVPPGWVAVSNGTLVAETTDNAGTTFSWVMDRPMATYLATIAVGEYRRVDSPDAGGVTRRDYVPSDLADHLPAAFDRVDEMLTLLEDWFGPYPFSEYGHVVVPAFPGALEAQTMTVIGRGAISDEVVVHELAHQWYGDDVSVAGWSDIWLNEGFATFAEFIWLEHDLGSDAMNTHISALYRFLETTAYRPIAEPGVAELFDAAVYFRGGITLHVLRSEVGDEMMKQILATYASRFSGGNAGSDDFLAVVAEIAGRDLSGVLGPWLYQSELPPLP